MVVVQTGTNFLISSLFILMVWLCVFFGSMLGPWCPRPRKPSKVSIRPKWLLDLREV